MNPTPVFYVESGVGTSSIGSIISCGYHLHRYHHIVWVPPVFSILNLEMVNNPH